MKNKECSVRLKNLYHKMKFQHHTVRLVKEY
jgi:hypothetical protein